MVGGCSGSRFGRDIHSHESAEETDQHSDTQTEKNHRSDIKPKVLTRHQQEETQSNSIHQSCHKRGYISRTIENLVGNKTRCHGAYYATH